MSLEKSVCFIERVKLVAVLYPKFFFLSIPVNRREFFMHRLVFFVILGIPDKLLQRLYALLLLRDSVEFIGNALDLSTEFIDRQDILISEKAKSREKSS